MSLCIILLLLLKLNNIMNVCLIGYNLTNFVTALALIKKSFTVDILYEKIIKFDKGKIGILFGKLKSFFTSINLIFLNYVVIPIL